MVRILILVVCGIMSVPASLGVGYGPPPPGPGSPFPGSGSPFPGPGSPYPGSGSPYPGYPSPPTTPKPTTTTTTTTKAPIPELKPDSRTLDQIYADAVAELGSDTFVIYAGEETPFIQYHTLMEFKTAFPLINIEIVVDLSKVHAARLDVQLAKNSPVVDLIQLSTLADFPRWKSLGVLHPYKPIGQEHIFKNLTDPEGAWTPMDIYALSNNILTHDITENPTWPIEAEDYLDPSLHSKLVMTFPNDDDAVLFLFHQIITKYGWDWLEGLVAQNVTWIRGTQVPRDRVNRAEFLATLTSSNSFFFYPAPSPPQQPRFVLPREDPFVVWAQRAAILESSRHKEAAKLYLSWSVGYERQKGEFGFSIRSDGPAPVGYKGLWDYPNGNPLEFEEFLSRPAELETFRRQVALFIGEPVGANPNGNFGTSPVKGV